MKATAQRTSNTYTHRIDIRQHHLTADEPRELDVGNEGNRIVEPLTAVIDLVRRRAPTFTAFVAMAIAKWRKFDTLYAVVEK